jgi:hypothetical protein
LLIGGEVGGFLPDIATNEQQDLTQDQREGVSPPAVADSALLLVSSANVSPSAFAHNMELGLLVRGGPLPARVRDHFHGLAAAGVLCSQ